MQRDNLFRHRSLIKQIRYMIILLVVSTVIILTMVFVWFFFHYRNTVMEYANMSLGIYAENTENELERFEQGILFFLSESSFQEDIKTTCSDESSQFEFYRASLGIRDRVADLYTQFDYLNEYAVLNLEGVCKIKQGFSDSSELDEFSRGFIERNQAMDYAISERADNSLLFICNVVDVYKTGYRIIGYMAFSLDTQKLFGVFSRTRIFGGQFVIRKGNEAGRVIGGGALSQEFLDTQGIQNGLKGEIVPYRGQNYYISTSSSEGHRFTYQLVIPMEQIDGANLQFLVWMALGVLAIVALAGIFVAFSLKNVLSPVRRMQKDLAVIENGEFQVTEEKDFNQASENEIDILHMNFCRSIHMLQNSIEEKQKYQDLLKGEQLKQLQLQMNPHFLYNTLDILYWDALAEGSDNTAEMIHCMGKMFRFATDIRRDVVALSEEVELLKAYATICGQRYRNRLEIRIEIEEQFYPVKIPKFSLQPILENAVNATVRAQLGYCLIIVGAGKRDGMLEVYVKDNGKGIDEQTMEVIKRGEMKSKDTGIALYNIHQRLQYLFGKECGIFTGEIDGMKAVGFRVRIDS